MKSLLRYLPRGNTLDDEAWHNRHRILLWVLAIHLPVILALGLFLRAGPADLATALVVPIACLAGAYLIRARRPASIVMTAGLTWCSMAFVLLSAGSVEAHFHFFIIIGFIALYQDWVPFLWNILFTVVSHGVGSAVPTIRIFNHPAALASPWVWSAIHGVAVLCACVGLVIFWWVSEQEGRVRTRLATAHQAAEAEIGRRRFASDLLVNLARRNQSMLYRQLEIINQLEEKERDPDALAVLFKLDHLATRVRRNAENLMVLSGEMPSRVWSAPVPLREVVQAAIAETEDLDRVQFTVDERLAVAGHTVTDLTHLLAELTENAVRYSPPDTHVTLACRTLPHRAGAQLITIEDWGVGMTEPALQEMNALLADPPEVDLSVSQRLGFHVVARLAQRHQIEVTLNQTPGGGVTAAVVLPSELFASGLVEQPVSRGASGRSSSEPLRSMRGLLDSAPHRAEDWSSSRGHQTSRHGAHEPVRAAAYDEDQHRAREDEYARPQAGNGLAAALGSARNGHTGNGVGGNGLGGNGVGGNGLGGNGVGGNGLGGSGRDADGHDGRDHGRNGHDEHADQHGYGGPEQGDGGQAWEPVERGPRHGLTSDPIDLPRLAELAAQETQVVWSNSGGAWDGWWKASDNERTESPEAPPNWASGQRLGEQAGPIGPGPAALPPVPPPPVERPQPHAEHDTDPDDGSPKLNRRRPQTHLAPELLKPSPRPRPAQPQAEVPAPRPASEALSRYQASRQAAQAEADKQGLTENGGAR